MIYRASRVSAVIAVIGAITLLASCSVDDESAVSNQPANADHQSSGAQTTRNSQANPATSNPFATTPKATDTASDHGHTHASEGSEQRLPADSLTADSAVREFRDAETYQPSPTQLRLKPVATDFVEWDPPTEVVYKQVDVMVSGPGGDLIKRSFGPGETIALDEYLPDGVYSWESVVTPEIDPYVREEMRRVREQGDLQAEQELIRRLRANGDLPTEAQGNANRRSGSFIVLDGKVRPSQVDEVTDELSSRG